MKRQSTYKIYRISFKRWRRTSWAVFASLKIVVHNCCTRLASFKDSLLKQQGANKSELVSLLLNLDTSFESEDVGVFWEEEQFLLKYTLLRIVPVNAMKEVSMRTSFQLLYIPIG